MPAAALIAAVFLAAADAAASSPAPMQIPPPDAVAVRTLRETYARALRHSDSVAASAQSLRSAEALYRQALGSSLPELSLAHDTQWSQRPSGGAPGVQHDGMARLSWSGLTGYRELALIKSARATAAQREQLRKRAEQLLLADVAGAFFGLLQARENANATAELLGLAERRLRELQDRVRVGRTREADAIGQEVQVSALRAQLEESERQAQARSDLLAFLVRTPADPTADAQTPPPPGPLEDYLARLETRPDVRAALAAVEAARGELRAARSGHLPELGLQANRYGYRPASRENNRWDASLSLSLPIFSWGAVQASADAAAAALGTEEYALQAARRQADLELRNAHRDDSSALRQFEIRSRTAALAQRDYELQRNDERRGLVTSLEVLESLNRLNNARLAYNSALLDARLAAIALELAAGAAPEELLR